MQRFVFVVAADKISLMHQPSHQRETSFGSDLANTREGLGESIEPTAATVATTTAALTRENTVDPLSNDNYSGDARWRWQW